MEIVNSIFEFLNNPMILTPLGLLLGKYLKWLPAFNTRAIPVFTLVYTITIKLVDLLTKIAPAPEVVPSSFIQAINLATVHADMAPAAFLGLGGFGGDLLGAAWGAVWQTAVTIGFHSAGKNTQQWLRAGGKFLATR